MSASSAPILGQTTGAISLSATNPALGKPVLYSGVPASLQVLLTNSTTGDIPLANGPQAAALQVFLPTYFSPQEVAAASISLADWKFTPGSDFLLLTYAGTAAGNWQTDTAIEFTITGLLCNAQPSPDPDTLQINPQNIPQADPQYTTEVFLLRAPQPGNAKLSDVLQLTLDNQGSVYVSTATAQSSDALANSLFLNIKNTGSAPLYTGTKPIQPVITASFVYGATSGALAPDTSREDPPLGSAWNIEASLTGGGNNWYVDPPQAGVQHPQWQLRPSDTNQQIIGIQDKANVSFAFTDIISFTPPGHTQLMLKFTGFAKDDNTLYDDELFVLDIAKQNPPPTRGLLNFASLEDPLVTVTTPGQVVSIQLQWSMLYVASVRLISSFPGATVYQQSYPERKALAYDSYTVTMHGITQSMPVVLTLQAFDGSNRYLNSLQFTVYLQAMLFSDPAGQVYPTVLIGNKIWLAQNLNFNTGYGTCQYYNNDPANASTYGRLYSGSALQQNLPPGWRLPSLADWQELVNNFGSPQDAYLALRPGGRSGFNAQLGGFALPNGPNAFAKLGTDGFYWTSTPGQQADANCFVQLQDVSQTLKLTGSNPTSMGMSVRYVRDF